MQINRFSKQGAFACVLAFFYANSLFGQFESATVLGTIHDSTGGVVPNAAVNLENVNTGVDSKTSTDGNGNYQFVNERLGTYRVRVEASGFDTAMASNFDLQVNARQRVDLTLQVGQTSQNITVTDAAKLLEADSSSRGQVINSRQIVGLPLNGRNYSDLTLLVPGVALSPLENQTDNSREGSFNVNGLRSEYSNYLLDGIDNNAYGTSNQGFSNEVIQPSPDALAQFKVETDNYSAEYGRAPGAVINATIKSGTNQFHGDLWEFFRNTSLNATGFFRPPTGGKLPFNQNQFGATFGGPVVKNKMFFFVDYEGFRRVYHQPLFATVPTAAAKMGDLSGYFSRSQNPTIQNPITGAVYPNGVIPQSAIIPFSQAILSALPDPNLPGTSNNYESAPADTTNTDKGDGRFDYYVNQRVSFFVRYSQSETAIFSPPSIPGPAGGNSNGNVFIRNKQGVPGVTWTISPTSILEARVGANYTEGGKNPVALGTPIDGFSVPNLPTDSSLAGGLYTLNMAGGLSQLGRQGSNPQFQNPLVIDPKVNFTKILGRHSLKMGFEYQLIDTAVSDFHPQYGADNYSGYFSNPAYFTNRASLNSLGSSQQRAYSIADLFFGARSRYELDNNPVAHLRQRMYFGYLQDDYKLNDRLTLNLGVRYEFATPQWERDNKLANFDPVSQSLIFASSGSLYNRALVHPNPNNWAPRVGLAFQATPSTVIRGSYAINYVHFNRLGGENLLAFNGPNIVDAFVDQQPAGVATNICSSVATSSSSCFRPTSLGFPNNFAAPSSFSPAITQVRYIPGSNRTGYVQSWFFDIQQRLAQNWLVDLAYVGNHTVGVTILADANQALPNRPGQSLSVNARRPIAGFTTIEEAFSNGFGSYNALQLKVEKRYTSGFYFLNSFTWSKAIDNAPGHLENYDGDNSRVNLYDIPGNRAISSYDQPFNDTLSLLYDIPYGKGRRFDAKNEALNLIAGGWSIDLINTATSGLPLNITYNPPTQGQVSTLVSYRPNLTGQPILTPNGSRTNYLNPAAFSAPNFTQPFGNAGRNIARGYGFYELDFGLHKNFNLWSESRYLQFRAEAFNLLNKTNFTPSGGFGTSINSGGFGQFTASYPPRQIQLALKLYF